MNIKLLKSKMVLFGDSQSALAEGIGINPVTLNLKFTQKREFKQTEIEAIAKRYRLAPHEVYEIFFKGGDNQ